MDFIRSWRCYWMCFGAVLRRVPHGLHWVAGGVMRRPGDHSAIIVRMALKKRRAFIAPAIPISILPRSTTRQQRGYEFQIRFDWGYG